MNETIDRFKKYNRAKKQKRIAANQAVVALWHAMQTTRHPGYFTIQSRAGQETFRWDLDGSVTPLASQDDVPHDLPAALRWPKQREPVD